MTSEQAELISTLSQGSRNHLYEFIGGSGYMVRLESNGPARVRTGTTRQMAAWSRGYQAGTSLTGADGWWAVGPQAYAERRDQARDCVADYRALLVDTSLDNAIRIQIMAALEERNWNFVQLAQAIGRVPQSVRRALQFLAPQPQIGSISLFEEMMRALNRPFVVPFHPDRGDVSLTELAGSRIGIESSGVRRMRALLIAVEASMIDAAAPGNPNKAHRALNFTIECAGETVVIARNSLMHWVRGVADGAQLSQATTALEALK